MFVIHRKGVIKNMSKYIDNTGIEYYPLYVADYPDTFFRVEHYNKGSNA